MGKRNIAGGCCQIATAITANVTVRRICVTAFQADTFKSASTHIAEICPLNIVKLTFQTFHFFHPRKGKKPGTPRSHEEEEFLDHMLINEPVVNVFREV